MAELRTKDVRPLIKAALDAAPVFAAEAVVAVVDDGEKHQDTEQERELNARKMVLVLSPVLVSETKSESAARIVEAMAWSVTVRRIKDAAIDHDDACDAVIGALLGLAKTETVRGLKCGVDGTIRKLVRDDAGLFATEIFFTVPISTSA